MWGSSIPSLAIKNFFLVPFEVREEYELLNFFNWYEQNKSFWEWRQVVDVRAFNSKRGRFKMNDSLEIPNSNDIDASLSLNSY